jgi:hypothetical protein
MYDTTLIYFVIDLMYAQCKYTFTLSRRLLNYRCILRLICMCVHNIMPVLCLFVHTTHKHVSYFLYHTQPKITSKISHLLYSNILTQCLFQKNCLRHISSDPTFSLCLLLLVFGFNTVAAKPITDIGTATSLPNL